MSAPYYPDSLPKSVRPFYEHLRQTLGPQDIQEILEEFRSEWDTPTEKRETISGSNFPPEQWLARFFPSVATARLASHHLEFWDWIHALTPGVSPPAFVACWPRGGGKSTTVELGITYAGCRLSRRFALIVSETQSQADERVKSIADHFTALGVGNATNEQGYSLGWRANQLRTANGFNVVGIGLDKATRGVKLGKYRPDWIIFDDIDGRLDTPLTIQKKKTTLTESILKAGSTDLAATFVQNLIHAKSIMAEVIAGTADFLLDRNAVQIVKAVDDLRVVQEATANGRMLWRIAEGSPTWEGQSLSVCEADINRAGLKAFRRESQQEVDEDGGGLWDGLTIRYVSDVAENGQSLFPIDLKGAGLPVFDEIVVAVDPSGSRRGDEAGIVAAGSFTLPGPGNIKAAVVIEDISDHLSPKQWAQESIALYRRLGAKRLLCERNFGGELVEDNLKDFPGAPKITMVSVTNGKLIRAEPIQQRYESGLVWHARRLPSLEQQMNSWQPGTGMDSPGSLDAMVIALSVLFGIADFVHPEKPSKTVAMNPIGLMSGYSRRGASSGSGSSFPGM